MPVKDAIELLRKRFNGLRTEETFSALQGSIGVPRARLSNFASGGLLRFEDLQKIERWCDAQEPLHGDTP